MMMSDSLVLLGGGAVAAMGFLVGLIALDRRRRQHLARLQSATLNRQSADPTHRDRKRKRSASKTDVAPLGRLLARLDHALIGAGFRISAAECLAQLGMGVLALYAALVLGLRLDPLTAVPMALVIPVGALLGTLRFFRARRLAAFTAGLPEALDVFSRGLKAGRPVSDSLGIVIETAPDPVRAELAICHGQICLGTSLADAWPVGCPRQTRISSVSPRLCKRRRAATWSRRWRTWPLNCANDAS